MTDTTTPMQSRERLGFIDGLRGIAALIVAVGHTIGMVGPDHPVLPLWQSDLEQLLMWPWLFGEQMVWLFIMLSGFALYWSEESRVLTGRGPTSLRTYVKRRAWRILPTYYVALALGFIVVVLLGPLLVSPSPSLATYDPVTAGGVFSHVLLLQNLNPGWMYQMNPPLWSIAVEVQLYLLFPVLLLLRTRLGLYWAAFAVVAAVFVINQLVPFAVFSLIEWFAVGAVLAHIVRRKVPSTTVMWVIFAATASIGLLRIPGINGRAEELLWMISFCALILALCGSKSSRWNIPTWRLVRWLGVRSYSLYAVHFPVALLAWALVVRFGMDRPFAILCVVIFGMAASISLSQLTYSLVEAPSLKRSRGKLHGDFEKPPRTASLPHA